MSLGKKNKWDYFICHASEDKDSIVRPLAKAILRHGFTVWYDEYSLKPGDSLRRSIEKGLECSEYGIVILSLCFFRKKWPQDELDALVALEKKLIPVWYSLKRKDVASFSPLLAGKLAISASKKLNFEEIQGMATQIIHASSPNSKRARKICGIEKYLFILGCGISNPDALLWTRDVRDILVFLGSLEEIGLLEIPEVQAFIKNYKILTQCDGNPLNENLIVERLQDLYKSLDKIGDKVRFYVSPDLFDWNKFGFFLYFLASRKQRTKEALSKVVFFSNELNLPIKIQRKIKDLSDIKSDTKKTKQQLLKYLYHIADDILNWLDSKAQ